ncbi:MAG: hypothetical protein J6X18_11730 [Bacteroidales bacterium]|nr:hypothetical protein [Bacteroidales bacterium]
MTVFDVFQETPYTYLEISRGEVFGNIITKETEHMGIFKQRESQETLNNIELFQSSATLHVHPEDYENYADIIGNGIRFEGVDYEITNMTRGTNFDNGQIEHLTFTLQRASFSEPQEAES